MVTLEKNSGTIKSQEDCVPRHGKSVDQQTIKKGSINRGEL